MGVGRWRETGWVLAVAVMAGKVVGQQDWTDGNTTDVTIDLLNVKTWPWGTTYRMLWDEVNPPAGLFFSCSATIDYDRVNQPAFAGCTVATGSGGDTIPPLSPTSPTLVCSAANSDSDRRPISLSAGDSHTVYYMSLTNGTGTRVGGGGGPAQGGVCTTGAKVAVELIPLTSPLVQSGGAYSCAGVACPTQTTCRYQPCSFGSCFPDELVATGTGCDDGNSLTATDQCNVQGECAGTADYTFVLRFATGSTALNPISSLALTPFEWSPIVADLGSAGLPTSVTSVVVLTAIVEEFSSVHTDVEFSLVGYRNYFAGNLSLVDELANLIGQTVTYRGGVRNITAVVAVSTTPSLSPTAAPTSEAPTAAGGQSNAAAGSGGIVSSLQDNYIYVAAGAGVLLVVVLIVVVKRRSKRDSPSSLSPIKGRGTPTNINETYTRPDENVNQIIDRTSIRVVPGQTRPRADTGDALQLP